MVQRILDTSGEAMQYYKKQLRVLVGAVLLLVVLLTALGIYNSIMHSGKIGVEIQAVPGDAQISLNGKQVSSGKIYLKAGTYTFTATKQGFDKSTADLDVSSSHHYVGLLLNPVSDEAKKWATDNQARYEKVGSQMADVRATVVEKENPLLAKLPYIDVMGPFSIDYTFSSEGSSTPYIIIKNSTSAGRVRALQWIRNQGVDLADLTIQFNDFDNPTNQGDY